MDGACKDCGIDLSGITEKLPKIDLVCNHDGTLDVSINPNDDSTMRFDPGDAFEVLWELNYPEDGRPPTVTEIGVLDEHWGTTQGDHSGAVPGDSPGGVPSTDSRTLAAFAARADTGVAPDSFEKLTGYRGWIITPDNKLSSTAYRGHVWKTRGPEVANCQREQQGHHVSVNLYRLRQEIAELADDDQRKPGLTADIDREIMTARRSPERNCSCGIYAVHDPELIEDRIGIQPGIVYGRVKAWGKIADYDQGYRAEKVDIDCLYRPKSWKKRHQVAKIAKSYGTHVEKPPVDLPDSDPEYTKMSKTTTYLIGSVVLGLLASSHGLASYIENMVVYTAMFLAGYSAWFENFRHWVTKKVKKVKTKEDDPKT